MRTITFNHNANPCFMPEYSPNFNQYDVRSKSIHTAETWLTERKTLPQCAVIELSTNAVKLLVNLNPMATAMGSFDFNDFYRQSARTDTGMMLSFDNMLNVQSFIDKVLPVIKEYANMAKNQYHVDVIYTVATAAYRTAGNQKEILHLIKQEAGLNVRILPKEEEATATLWAYIFSTSDIARLQSFKNHFLLDQGAGSTEISLFQNKELVFSHSFEMGSMLLKTWLYRRLSANLRDAISNVNELSKMKIQHELNSLQNLPKDFNNSYCIGVGKAITEATGKISNPEQHEIVLTIEKMKMRMETLKDQLCNKYTTVEEVKHAIDNHRDRSNQKLIPCLGLPVVISILETFHIQELTVSGTGLFYGIFFENFFNLNK